MLIAMDYDRTFTADPKFWEQVVALGRSAGHKFICVTGRVEPPHQREHQLPYGVPVICAGDALKRDAAEKQGYQVDVWIDDMPGTIERQSKLDWP